MMIDPQQRTPSPPEDAFELAPPRRLNYEPVPPRAAGRSKRIFDWAMRLVSYATTAAGFYLWYAAHPRSPWHLGGILLVALGMFCFIAGQFASDLWERR
jgi:hypothetical protein